jgi:hydroxysqualene dehydroxylase
MTDRSVIVIGGGLSGISASLECARAGAAVTLLESRGRLGGAAYSFTRDGVSADNGQHVFLRCCTQYRRLLDDLGAEGCVTLQSRLAIPVLAPGGRRATLARSRLPAPLHLAGSLARYGLLSVSDRGRVALAMAALRRVNPDDPAADAISFGAWLAEHRQSPAAIETIWDLIARPTLNLAPADASLAQAAQVFRVGLLEDSTAADIGYARAPLSEIHDRAARDGLRRAGVEVQLRRGVTSVTPEPDGFRVEAGGTPALRSKAVILAVQADRLARLLPPDAGLSVDRLHKLGSSPIINLHVLFDRRVTDLTFAAGVNTPVQWFFDRTGSGGVKSGQYLAISLSAADAELAMTAEELQDRYLTALGELLPASRRASVVKFFVTREHAATFRAAPGARALRPGARTQIEGLALAGAFTDTGWPATMEGAVRSGLIAARQVLTVPEEPSRPSAAPSPELAGSVS